MDLKRLLEFFGDLEETENLCDFAVNDIKMWQYARVRIFTELTQLTGMFSLARSKDLSSFNILKASPSLLFYSIFSNPLWGRRKVKNFFFGGSRKVDVDGQFVNPIVDCYIDKYSVENYLKIESLANFRHPKPSFFRTGHEDFQEIRTAFLRYFSKFQLSQDQVEFLSRIEQLIYEGLGVHIDLKERIRFDYVTFRANYSYYMKLLKKRKVSKVYIVCSYDYKAALTAACNALEIECVELQHGVLNDTHIGYMYPEEVDAEFFPDKFYAWGEYWRQQSKFLSNKVEVCIKGYPYFSLMRERYASISKDDKQILVISQGPVGKKMSELLCDDISQFDGYRIVYKLHPGECDRWRKDYPQLVELSQRPNVIVADDNTTSIYEYLSRSAFVVGVYSTALYEALGFNCQVSLMNIEGVEYFRNLVNDKKVVLLDRFKDIDLNYDFKRASKKNEFFA